MLNLAAAPGIPNRSRLAATLGAIALLTGLTAGHASALEGIDLSSPAEATAAGACPQLIQIKYPLRSCVDGQLGQTDANETWDNTRHMPMQSHWIEGDGYFGPELNPVSN